MKRNLISKLIGAAFVIALLTGTAVHAMGSGKTYIAAEVKETGIVGKVKESGKIHGETDKIYYSTVTAPIEEVNVRLGDSVSKDDVLVKYDSTDLQRAKDEAEIRTAQSEADYSGSVKKSDYYESKYKKALSDDNTYALLYWMYREKGNDISEEEFQRQYNIQCQIDAVNRDIAEKEREISDEQHRKNKASGYGTKDEDDYSKRDIRKIKKAQKEIDKLNTELAELKKQLYVTSMGNVTPAENEELNDVNNVLEDISRNWSETKNEKSTYENYVLNDDEKSAIEKQAELSRKEEEETREDLDKANSGIKSDFAGVVTSLEVDDGAYVSKGEPLFTIETSESIVCRTDISRYDIMNVKVGQDAEVNISGKIYKGKVNKIKALAKTDSSDKSKVEVDVSIDNASDAAIIGLEADVTIFTEQNTSALVIPVEAFYSDSEGDYCYVISGGKIEKKYVTAGIDNGDDVEITEGLAKGDIVVTDAITDDAIGERAKYVID